MAFDTWGERGVPPATLASVRAEYNQTIALSDQKIQVRGTGSEEARRKGWGNKAWAWQVGHNQTIALSDQEIQVGGAGNRRAGAQSSGKGEMEWIVRAVCHQRIAMALSAHEYG